MKKILSMQGENKLKNTFLILIVGLFIGCAPRSSYKIGFRYVGPVDQLGTREYDGEIRGSSYASSYAMTDFERQLKEMTKILIDGFEERLRGGKR